MRKKLSNQTPFATSLFALSAANEREKRENSNKVYCVGDIVSYKNSKQIIISITDQDVEIEDINFPLFTETLKKAEFLEHIPEDERKSFEGYGDTKTSMSSDFNIQDYIGCTYIANKREYQIQSADNTGVTVVDLLTKAMLYIEVTQVFDVDDVKPYLVDVVPAKKQEPKTRKNTAIKTAPVENGVVQSLFSVLGKEEETPDTVSSSVDIQLSDYHYDTLDEPYRTKNERIKDNIEAITLVKKILSDKRAATAKEQSIISKFSGWGGLDVVFSRENTYYEELTDLLTAQEYAAAKSSILSAFYTPTYIISAVYSMLQKLGFKNGKILDPSCGIGKFFGAMPKEMFSNSSLFGGDVDKMSADIARLLYPSANINQIAFEKTDYSNDLFDLAITNVPFGEFSVNDSVYNKYKMNIHNYFIAKMIDKVRPGGIVIALTSSYTMDSQNKSAREYFSDRAELIGAVRLSDSAFKNASTEVVTDILIFQKLMANDKINDNSWLESVTETFEEVSYNLNSYYVSNPNHILGEKKVVSGRFGDKVTYAGDNHGIDDVLSEIANNTRYDYKEAEIKNDDSSSEVISLPDEFIGSTDFSYVVYNDSLWYREGSKLTKYIAKNKKSEDRIRHLIPLKNCLVDLVDAMVQDKDDSDISALQSRLSYLYDKFVQKYGRISSVANSRAFREDSKYPLLCSLEIYNDDGEFVRKAEIFTERTIGKPIAPKAEDTTDALYVSISEKGYINFDYMSSLLGMETEDIKSQLIADQKIFKIPFSNKYEDRNSYLSGNVRKKLEYAKKAAETNKTFEVNVSALTSVIPKDIPANEIYVAIGSTWVDECYYEEFIHELLNTPQYNRDNIKVCYSNDKYYISNKGYDEYRVIVNVTYGTKRASAYKLFEDALNLVSTRVFDYIEVDGKKKAVLNEAETTLAQQKQEVIKLAFAEWIWKDYERREKLVRKYNDEMNNIVPCEYDGSKIRFEGMNSKIELMPHQKNAVARMIQSGNTLLAHVVGAGKTFSMIAGAIEKKRLGLSNKPLFIVPNHLVEQWAGEILRLYPFANVLITRKDDFKRLNRKKFCAKIATGNYDAVIMSHSQFSRIPMSREYQIEKLNQQLAEIEYAIGEIVYYDDGSTNQKKYTARQLEIAKKKIEEKLEKLNESQKDDTVTFEELGVDMLLLDEAHLFKNLYVYTKLSNVAGLTNSNSKKAQDLLMKTSYLNEITNYKGLVFATGTPISNAICELYVMQKYLQPKDMEDNNIYSFDSWVSHFAEKETKIEVKPEGSGYRSVDRFCRYHNLPELMNLFRLCADIRMADQVNLDVPTARQHNIAINPSETQEKIVKSFAERAEAIRKGDVDSNVDNMLVVTNDGRKLAIDQRMYDINLADDKKSKLNRCSRTVYKIWQRTTEYKATQLVFLDLGTPKKDNNSKSFNAYEDIKQKLIKFGVPENEVAFIHDANTDEKKKVLFNQVNAGEVRILIGSTEKLGAGTNVQKRLIAIHNIDCPWRPSDLQQREGRIVRQGNMFDTVHVYSYVTKNTFDTYLYQTVLNKAEPIAQIMSSRTPQRDMEDIDTACLNYAEIKALSTGNPAIREKMELEEKVAKLKILRSSYSSNKYSLEEQIKKNYPNEILSLENRIEVFYSDKEFVENNYPLDEETSYSPMTIGEEIYDKKADAASMLDFIIKHKKGIDSEKVGTYRGFNISIKYEPFREIHIFEIHSPTARFIYNMEAGSGFGNITRLNNFIDGFDSRIAFAEKKLATTKQSLLEAEKEFAKPFSQEDDYQEAVKKLAELNKQLSVCGL